MIARYTCPSDFMHRNGLLKGRAPLTRALWLCSVCTCPCHQNKARRREAHRDTCTATARREAQAWRSAACTAVHAQTLHARAPAFFARTHPTCIQAAQSAMHRVRRHIQPSRHYCCPAAPLIPIVHLPLTTNDSRSIGPSACECDAAQRQKQTNPNTTAARQNAPSLCMCGPKTRAGIRHQILRQKCLRTQPCNRQARGSGG